jgi:hypothetical protein
MEANYVNALALFFKHGAIQLREPRFRKMPFFINYAVLDTLPIVREQIFALMDGVLNPSDFDAIATAPAGAKYWPAIYADRHGLPFVMPIEVAPSVNTPLALYGEQKIGNRVVMLNSFNPPYAMSVMDQHPFVRMYDVLHAVHYKVAAIVTLFDADRLHFFRSYFSSRKTEVKSVHIFDMYELLQTVNDSPTAFEVDPCLAAKAVRHYEQSRNWYSS